LSSRRRRTSWCTRRLAAHSALTGGPRQTSLAVLAYNIDGFLVSMAPALSGSLGVFLVRAGVVRRARARARARSAAAHTCALVCASRRRN
jgi:hypothetical protein